MANYSDAALAAEVRELIKDVELSHKRRRQQSTIVPAESAATLDKLRAAVARLDYFAGLSPLQQQFLGFVGRIEPSAKLLPLVATETQAVTYCTGAQWEEITKLLNHASFSKADRTQGLMKLNKLTEEGAVAYILELRAKLPTDEQYEAVRALLDRKCFSEENRAMGLRKLAELGRAGVASYLPVLEKLVADLEAAPAHPMAQLAGTHPALVSSAYDQARTAYLDVLKHPRIEPEERDRALAVIDEWTEAELRSKTAGMCKLIQQRETTSVTEAVAA